MWLKHLLVTVVRSAHIARGLSDETRQTTIHLDQLVH